MKEYKIKKYKIIINGTEVSYYEQTPGTMPVSMYVQYLFYDEFYNAFHKIETIKYKRIN